MCCSDGNIVECYAPCSWVGLSTSIPSPPCFRVELSVFLARSYVVRLSVLRVRALSASTVSDLGGSLSCSDLSWTAMCDSLPESDQSKVIKFTLSKMYTYR